MKLLPSNCLGDTVYPGLGLMVYPKLLEGYAGFRWTLAWPYIGLSGVPPDYWDMQEVFSPPHRSFDCAINLLQGGRLFSCSPPESAAMEEYIWGALAKGFIWPSRFPAGAGFLFLKKGTDLRSCIDYRDINPLGERTASPCPLWIQLLSACCGPTKLDLHSAYNLNCIRAGDEWKAMFITPIRHYKYVVMLFGLVNAPVVFQCFINEVLLETLYHYAFIYLDDILIFSASLDEHVVYVWKALLLLQHQLYINGVLYIWCLIPGVHIVTRKA